MLLAAAIPILVAKCLACHNTEVKTSGFDLSTRAGLIAGGKGGEAVVPGAAAKSRLFQYVSAGKMPPSRPLEPGEIEEIRKWIDSGAEYETAKLAVKARPRAGKDWWSLQTPKKPEVPRVDGVSNPIDAFVIAKLREKGLEPSARADNRTLVRRLYFAMTGLPPSAAEQNAPFEQAVESVLASPRYGERWARHWLDVVRFGESDGGEHNFERMTAWRYRDYVIDAFNSDKPYTQFIKEQIAGDVLDRHDAKLVAATGFLVAGPWDSVTKELNKDDAMRKVARQDELDDFVTTTFATFQGLTVNCARCHDHKFDPIPTRDYYRLTAAFRGVTYGERPVYTEQQKADREALSGPVRKQLGVARKQLAAIDNPVRVRLLTERYQKLELSKQGKHIPVNPVFNRNTFGVATARHFRFVITAQQSKTGNTRVDRFELLPAGKSYSWRGEKTATDDQPAVFEIHEPAPVKVSEIRWVADAEGGMRDGAPRVYRFEVSEDGVNWRELASSLGHEVPAEFELPDVSEAELTAAIPATQQAERNRLAAEVKRLQSELDAIPPLPSVHAAKLEPEMTPAFLLDRGSIAKPVEEVKPGALSAIAQLAADLPAGTDGERRTALAEWIANDRNPLTARVLVNRVWYYHFGNGIVNTPSDFGFNGDRPSHPELLDWLATEFMAHGWSIKWLQRQILTSRTWQQSSKINAKAHALDGGNRLLWRMEPRRMDAEMIRDTMLAVSGGMNPERGGPSFLLQKKQTKGSYLYLAQDETDPRTWRRSVYKFVARGAERIFMDSFDCPDPAVATPQRSVSNTPVQALTLLNNPFVLTQAELLGKRVKSAEDAYQVVFGRSPSAREREEGERFIAQYGAALYCRALFNTNEFLYVP